MVQALPAARGALALDRALSWLLPELGVLWDGASGKISNIGEGPIKPLQYDERSTSRSPHGDAA